VGEPLRGALPRSRRAIRSITRVATSWLCGWFRYYPSRNAPLRGDTILHFSFFTCAMLQLSTLQFLRDIKANNNKDWFHSHRTEYDAARNNILGFTELLIKKVCIFDNDLGYTFLDPRKCITRINRDLRFSKDKTPYKTDYYIIVNKDGKSSISAFYYLHIEADQCDMGGGIYTPEPAILQKIRQEIDYNPQAWLDLATSPDLLRHFPNGVQTSHSLQKTPASYREDHLAKDALRMKDFYTQYNMPALELTQADAADIVAQIFAASKPLVDYLNRAIYF
jgi:uncharacterized protein (TIGR02453 family)